VTEAYLDSQSLAVGDVLTFRRKCGNQAGSLSTSPSPWELAGTVRGFPGTSCGRIRRASGYLRSHTTLKQLVDIVMSKKHRPERYLVALRAGADWGAARTEFAAWARRDSRRRGRGRAATFRPLFRAFLRNSLELEMAFHGRHPYKPESGSFCTAATLRGSRVSVPSERVVRADGRRLACCR